MAADEPGYAAINLANWESRVPLHLGGYELDRFRSDPTFLSDVVRFDRARLGDVAGLDTVHLQCHIGTDTLSLARLGARMTGLDFSPSALAAARSLARDCGAEIDYVESELHGAVGALGAGRFDLVYTGIGALCWLPSAQRWAEVVATLLRPGGRLFIREGHPVLWALCDPRPDAMLSIEHPYFEVDGGTPFSVPTTYVDHDEPVGSPDIVHFNHGLGEIITAVLGAGMRLDAFEEHRSIPWDLYKGASVVVPGTDEYELADRPERLPASYTLQATKL